MRTPGLKREGLLALFVVLALVAGACGDDDASDTAAPTTVAASTEAPTTEAPSTEAPTPTAASTEGPTTEAPAALAKSEIVIGQPVTLSGPVTTGHWAADTAAVWQQWVNDNGGINGHPVRVVTVDGKGDPAGSQAAVAEMIDDGVIAVVGQNEIALQAWYQLLVDAGIPSIGGICFTPSICSGDGASPLYFTATTGVPAITQGSVLSGSLAGATVFGGVVCAEVAACAQVEQIYDGTAPTLGMEFAGIVKIAGSATDYTAECLQMQANGIEYAQLATQEAVALRFVQDCATQGYIPRWDLTDGTASMVNLEDVAEITGGPVSGAIEGFPWWLDEPAVVEFREAYETYAPDLDYQDSNVTATWAAFELFRKAMANVSDNPTSEEVIEAMLALEDEDLGGLLPQKLNYTAGEAAPPVNCFWLYEYEADGGLSVVHSNNPSGNSVTDGDLKSECYPPLDA